MEKLSWEKFSNTEYYQGFCYRMPGGNFMHKRTIESMEDSTMQHWRKGDLVQFFNGILPSLRDKTWWSWFTRGKVFKKFLKQNPSIRDIRIPFYAINEYGLIIGRYKKTKYFDCRDDLKFYNYGSVIMLLTGSKPGRIKRCYGSTLFNKISSYPHEKIPPQLKQFEKFIKHNEDSDESRNYFVSKVYSYFNK